MKTRIQVGNDGVGIDLSALLSFLNANVQALVFEELNCPVSIKSDVVRPATYNELAIGLDDDVLFAMIFTDKPYYNNYFYQEDGNVVIASFYAWEYLTKLPKNNGAAFFLMEFLAEHFDRSFRHTLNDRSKPECIYDFLRDKTGIDASMRASLVCPKCNTRIKEAVESPEKVKIFLDFKNLLNHIGNASKWDEDLIEYWKKMIRSSTSGASIPSLFISYAHADSAWLHRVKVQLKPLERKALIQIWEDTRIKIGENWKESINSALNGAKAAILLVSAPFLASDFIVNNELPPLLENARSKGVKIYPLLISPCWFEESEELSKFQAVNDPAKTLVEMDYGEQERILLSLARDVASQLEAS